jgi:uncharacterized membrane protein|tara:strand:+ start:321 stop:524 length:204 start_codon:yes stop_codon:yes gene_type:complete
MVRHERHIAKAFTWRVVGTIDTMCLGWLLTGDVALGASLGALEIVTKTVLYYLHERAWYRFKFGIKK